MWNEEQDPLAENDQIEEDGRAWRIVQTAVTLLILTCFLGVILVTFYNQFTGRQTMPANLPHVAFMNWDEAGILQLYAIDPFAAADLRQLTFETGDVVEFAVSPQGTAVAYVTELGAGETAVKLLDWNRQQAANHRTILECAAESCSRLVWHPDGRRLVLERRDAAGARLWWLDTQTGATVTVLADETAVSHSAAFSHDGRWLSFSDPLNEEMALYELEKGSQIRLASSLGQTAVWHPDAYEYLFSDLDLVTFHGDNNETTHQEHGHDFAQSIHLVRGDITGDSSTLLAETGNVDDGNPAWSPDGKWIAFGRQAFGLNNGRQLWLLNTETGESYPITDEAGVHHGPPTWSADGRFLIYQRFNLAEAESKPDIWLMELGNDRVTAVAETGILPAWIP